MSIECLENLIKQTKKKDKIIYFLNLRIGSTVANGESGGRGLFQRLVRLPPNRGQEGVAMSDGELPADFCGLSHYKSGVRANIFGILRDDHLLRVHADRAGGGAKGSCA